MTREELIQAISEMSVLELSELVKELEEKFGVSAAAPAMMMPMGGMPAAGAAAPAEEEKTEFDVVLLEHGANKIGVIKVVREITGLGLKEAKEMVDGAPKTVKEAAAKEEAEEMKKKLEEAVANTMVGGATLTKLIGTSAWYAPGAASAMMVEAILNDQKKMIPCCCYLDGEYGQKDICIGVPAIIGRKGIEKIVKIDLSKEEAEKFAASADAVRKTNNVLHEIKAI